jgi:hypothetical protein
MEGKRDCYARETASPQVGGYKTKHDGVAGRLEKEFWEMNSDDLT